MSLFDLNRAMLIGNITRDPELKYTPKGTALLRFTIATNRSMQNEDGSYKDMPTFHTIIAWSKLAERMAKVLEKGKKVYIEGRIENRSYEVEGQKKFTSEVVADNIISFDKAKSMGGGAGMSTATPSRSKTKKSEAVQEPADMSDEMDENVDPDDIPF
jgi:single-strand DNA-binding protein